jgi:signal transduction histidine kinase
VRKRAGTSFVRGRSTSTRARTGAASVSRYIRTHLQQITFDWERAVRSDLKELAKLDRGALIDHLPEVLEGLAVWVEGRTAAAEVAFAALADGHALQRLGFGIELATINIEYAWMRHVLLGHLLTLPFTPAVRRQLYALNDGLDRAIHFALRRYMEHRDYLRDRFIGILGHDLRNPLTAVKTTTQGLLRSSAPGSRERGSLEVISRAADRMERMIGDVLDFARSHFAGGIPATPVKCDMGEICRSAVDEARSGHPGRTIELRTRGDLRGTFDRDRVFQALGNLITNALQYGEDPVVVEAFEVPGGDAVVTRISNRGAAIPKDILPKLFTPFARVGGGAKGSLGLGLFIAAQINRAHGGTSEVESSAKETTFTLRWPRAEREKVPDRT